MVCAGDETVACLGALAGSGSAMEQTRVASTMAQSVGSAVRRRYETTSGVDRTLRVARASGKIPYPRTAQGVTQQLGLTKERDWAGRTGRAGCSKDGERLAGLFRMVGSRCRTISCIVGGLLVWRGESPKKNNGRKL
jgi:hypothetical protein